MRSPVLVTGATGFLGTYVVSAMLRAGLSVRAIVRPGVDESKLPWRASDALDIVRADLRQAPSLVPAVAGVSSVVHLAAVKSGALAERFAGTVVATENLLAAMVDAGVGHMVYCSTLSVYDYRAIRSGSVLDEASPIEADPARRDEYAQVKLAQERLVREWAQADRKLTVLRPGMIYGPGELWHSLIGIEVAGPVWLSVGSRRILPMAWVENVADAFVAALENPRAIGETFNILDDNLPTVSAYRRAVRPLADVPLRLVPAPLPVMQAAVAGLGIVNDKVLDGRLKLPGGFLPSPFAARFRALEYPNDKAKNVLGWKPRVSLEEALRRSQDCRLMADG